MPELVLPLPATRELKPRVPRGLLPDQTLAQLAGDGDDSAFAAIYERHAQGLYRYCTSMLGSHEDASDAVQCAMMKALLALPAKKKQAPLKPWLYRIAHNEAITIWRRRRSHEEWDDQANGGPAREPHDDVAVRHQLKQLVSDLLDLPERQRGALIMRELNGLGYAEIAAAFGLSEGGARQAVYEARTALHEREQGRRLSCQSVRRSLSAGDRRVMRGRRIRAHMRTCADCRDFEASVHARSERLAALAPALPASSGAALLQGILGGSSSGSSGGAGLLGGLAGAGAVATPIAVKSAALLAAALLVATGPGERFLTHGGRESSRVESGSSTAGAAVQPSPHRRGELRGAPNVTPQRGAVRRETLDAGTVVPAAGGPGAATQALPPQAVAPPAHPPAVHGGGGGPVPIEEERHSELPRQNLPEDEQFTEEEPVPVLDEAPGSEVEEPPPPAEKAPPPEVETGPPAEGSPGTEWQPGAGGRPNAGEAAGHASASSRAGF